MVIDVIAAGLHPRVRSQADGSHYTSTDELPLVPGIDGVGRGADGLLRYFILPDTTMGAMAEQTVIDTRRSIVLPEESDPIAVAAAMNPAMSSWVALRQRVPFQAGQNVLVLGATGNAARWPSRSRSCSARTRSSPPGATPPAGRTARTRRHRHRRARRAPRTVAHRLGRAASEVDVVIDYLWGEPTAAAMVAVVTDRADRGQPLTWIEIGSVAGPTAAIPSAALRAARLQIVGSGQGSVSTREILAELPALAQQITTGTFDIDARPTPLTDVERAWADAARAARA